MRFDGKKLAEHKVDTNRAVIVGVITVICFLALVYIVYLYLVPAIGLDWEDSYYPAAKVFMRGESPYANYAYGYFNPPWVLLALLPLALLPAQLGSAVMFVANLFAFAFVFLRLKISPWLIILLIAFSGVLMNSRYGNIDGLIALGFILPPPIGLFFVLAKPQIGIGIALYWAYCAWRDGGLRQLAKTFAPVVLAYLLTFALYGNIFASSAHIVRGFNNFSIFPFGLPIGIILLAFAAWKRLPGAAIAAGVFLVPYVNFFSWSFAWVGVASLPALKNGRITLNQSDQ